VQTRALALPAVGCLVILLTACGQAEGTKRLDDHRLVTRAGVSLAWSADGRRLAYTTRRGQDLLVIDADGSDGRRVSHEEGGASSLRWSPDGRTIAYLSRHGKHRDLLVIDADGSDKRRLSHDAGGFFIRWSPDGDRILFETEHGLSIINADGSGARSLTRDDADYESPSWSPDGQSIVFASTPPRRSGRADPNSGIYLMNADGTGRRRLTPPSERFDSPTWSPGGDRIAFVRSRLDRSKLAIYTDIFVIDADGTDQRRLTHGTGMFRGAVWSPDGETIAFSTGPAEAAGLHSGFGCQLCGRHVGVVRVDGTGQRRLTSVRTGNTAPAWSLDGSRIAFLRSTYPGNRGPAVFVMNADGSNQHRVTRNRKGQALTVWWPRSDMLAFAVHNGSLFFEVFVAPVE
jgi:Tol biopolymer transport system component